jgi:hypothetical protein
VTFDPAPDGRGLRPTGVTKTIGRPRALRLGLIASAAASLLLLAGCGAAQTGVPTPASMPMDAGAPVEAAAAAPSDRGPAIGPQVITTAWLTMRVDTVPAGVDEISAVVTARGGTIQQQDLTTAEGTQTATIVARVPASSLDGVLADVQRLGSVESVSRQSADVTQQRIDLDARIEALTASADRLRQLLDEAATVTDLVAVETELANRQAELDSLTAQRDYLADQVAMSTVTITLMPTVQAGGAAAPGLDGGLQNGIAALGATIGAAITALGFLLPFVAILVVLAIPVIWLVVRRRRRPH